jgi:hypothetical protein
MKDYLFEIKNSQGISGNIFTWHVKVKEENYYKALRKLIEYYAPNGLEFIRKVERVEESYINEMCNPKEI